MKRNRKLGISIPTYNRAEFLDCSLVVHVLIAKKYGIPIYIYDNASTDGTNEVVKKWQAEYEFIIYFRHTENVGAIKNIEMAIIEPEEEFVWLLGDTYRIPLEAVEYVLAQENHTDVFVFNLVNKLDLPSKKYKDRNVALSELSGLASCLSCSVFNNKSLSKIDFNRFSTSYYPHTCYVFEMIAFDEFTLDWVNEFSVEGLKPPGLKKSNWSATEKAIDIGVEDWLNFVMSLPHTYTIDSKIIAAKEFGVVSELLTFKGLLWMRANNGLNLLKLNKFSNSLELCISNSFKYYSLYFICLIPSKILKIMISQYLKK